MHLQLPRDHELIRIAYHRSANSAYGLENLAEMDYCWGCLSDEPGMTVIQCDGQECPRVYCLPCAELTEDTIPAGDWFCPACVNCEQFRQKLDNMTPAERLEANAVVGICMFTNIFHILALFECISTEYEVWNEFSVHNYFTRCFTQRHERNDICS